MTTLVSFAPTLISVFSFSATFQSGPDPYTVETPGNLFGERWYLRVKDSTNAVVVYRPMVQSGPKFRGVVSWEKGILTTSLALPHGIRVGRMAQARISQTNTNLDDLYLMRAIDSLTLAVSMLSNPQLTGPLNGQIDFPLDLLDGYGIGPLYYHADTQQFEF